MSWLQDTPVGVFVFALGLALLLAAIGFGMAVWSGRITGALRGRTPIPVNALTEGYHLVYGKATGPMLKSPLTRRPCVWWRVRIWERQITSSQSSEGGRDRQVRWDERRHEDSSRVIQCTQGFVNCAVASSGMTLAVPTEVRDWQGMKLPPEDRNPPAQPGAAFVSTSMADRGHLIVGGKLQGDRYRYREEIIVPNSELFVLGQVERVDPSLWEDEEDVDSAHGSLDDVEELGTQTDIDADPLESSAAWSEEADRQEAADMRQAQWRVGPQKGRPYIVAVQAPEHWLGTPQLAGKGGWVMGVAFAMLAAFMLWARLGAA